MSFSAVLTKVKPYLLMVFLQFGYAGMYVISVASLKRGMNHFVLVVYRNVAATILMAPFALWFERKVRPKMTLSSFLKIMALALLEPVLDQNMYYMGAKLTSASFAAALLNMLPAVTFVMAIILRMERVKIREMRGKAKVVGTLVTVAGALVMILYRGPILEFVWTRGRAHHQASGGSQDGGSFLKGTLLIIGSCISWSGFFILQANTLKSYPAELSLTTLICVMGTLESAAVTLVMERGSKPWSIGFDMNLITVVYSGVMCSGIAYYVQGIVIKERGPVFVTAFNPLCMIIVAILGSLILAEDISLGRVIGAIIIVTGLYLLIWGKSKDNLSSSSETAADEKKPVLELPISATMVDEKTNPGNYITVMEIPAKKS